MQNLCSYITTSVTTRYITFGIHDNLTHIIIIIIINIITAIIAKQIYIELDKGKSREKTGETKGGGVTSWHLFVTIFIQEFCNFPTGFP